MELHLWEGKAIVIFQRNLRCEKLKVYGELLKGHQGQNQGNLHDLL